MALRPFAVYSPEGLKDWKFETSCTSISAAQKEAERLLGAAHGESCYCVTDANGVIVWSTDGYLA